MLESATCVDLLDMGNCQDIHSITGLLLNHLANLEEPLIPAKVREKLTESICKLMIQVESIAADCSDCFSFEEPKQAGYQSSQAS